MVLWKTAHVFAMYCTAGLKLGHRVALGLVASESMDLVFSELVLCSYLDLLIRGSFDHEVSA